MTKNIERKWQKTNRCKKTKNQELRRGKKYIGKKKGGNGAGRWKYRELVGSKWKKNKIKVEWARFASHLHRASSVFNIRCS